MGVIWAPVGLIMFENISVSGALFCITYLLAAFALGYIGKGKTRGPARTTGDHLKFVFVWAGLFLFLELIISLFE